MWWEIWNCNREADNLPWLDPKIREKSAVWRIELRAGKRHLKNRWGIRTWMDLDEKLGDVYRKMLENIRYTEPLRDTNRSRWPDHEIWELAKQQLSNDLIEMMCGILPGFTKSVLRSEHIRMLNAQIFGLVTSLAVAKKTQHR